MFISDGVGDAAPNRPRDVALVQRLLNMNLGLVNRRRFDPLHPVTANGHYDSATQALMRAYAWSIGERGTRPAASLTAPPAAAGADADSEAYWQAKLALGDAMMFSSVAEVPTESAQSGPAMQVGVLDRANPVLRSLLMGGLAWQGQFPTDRGDPAVRALDSGSLDQWPAYKAVCRMRQSRSLLAVLLAMAPTIRRNRKATAAEIAESIALAMQLADINTPLRKAAFLAQVAAESDGFQALREYASGKAYEGRADLGNVLPGDGVRFAGRGYIQITGRANYTQAWHDLKLPMVHKPQLAPFATGPLAKFKSDLEPESPAHAEGLEGAAQVTAWYWNKHKLNLISDRLSKVGNQEPVLLKLSIAINGKNKKTGLPNGWEHRKQYFKAAKHALGIH